MSFGRPSSPCARMILYVALLFIEAGRSAASIASYSVTASFTLPCFASCWMQTMHAFANVIPDPAVASDSIFCNSSAACGLPMRPRDRAAAAAVASSSLLSKAAITPTACASRRTPIEASTSISRSPSRCAIASRSAASEASPGIASSASLA